MTTLNWFIMFFTIAGFMTFLARMKYLVDNPEKITRNEEGKIRWQYCFFINSIEILIGGTVGVLTGLIVEYYSVLEGNMVMFAVAMSGIVGSKIFETIQKKLNSKIEEKFDQFDI